MDKIYKVPHVRKSDNKKKKKKQHKDSATRAVQV